MVRWEKATEALVQQADNLPPEDHRKWGVALHPPSMHPDRAVYAPATRAADGAGGFALALVGALDHQLERDALALEGRSAGGLLVGAGVSTTPWPCGGGLYATS